MYGDVLREAIQRVQWANDQRRAEHHVLGMSALGGCREYVRASITSEVIAVTESDLKWAAMVGTMLGDAVEAIAERDLGGLTQVRLVLDLDVGDIVIQVAGTADLLFPEPPPGEPPAVVDLKTAAELYTVRREGPKFGYRAQIAGYLVAAVKMGLLPEDAVGELVFFDRSGKDSTTHSWRVTLEDAHRILEAASERLVAVAHAIDTGQQAPRDEDPSWCAAVGCPFYQGCWGDGTALEKIEDERSLDAVRRYKEARDEVKAATARRDTARDDLLKVAGVTTEGTRVSWTESARGTLTISVVDPK